MKFSINQHSELWKNSWETPKSPILLQIRNVIKENKSISRPSQYCTFLPRAVLYHSKLNNSHLFSSFACPVCKHILHLSSLPISLLPLELLKTHLQLFDIPQLLVYFTRLFFQTNRCCCSMKTTVCMFRLGSAEKAFRASFCFFSVDVSTI